MIDDKLFSELFSELDEISLEATAVSELMGLISDYEKEGANRIHCYSTGIWYVSDRANMNARRLAEVVDRISVERRKEAVS